jgi:hypothetical protein
VGLDASEGAYAALSWALAVGRRRGVPVRAVTVVAARDGPNIVFPTGLISDANLDLALLAAAGQRRPPADLSELATAAGLDLRDLESALAGLTLLHRPCHGGHECAAPSSRIIQLA